MVLLWSSVDLADRLRTDGEGGDMRDVAGKVAVITGAASGIGRGMAESFADAGMKIVLADIEQDALAKTTEALRGAGADAHAVVTDVSKPEQIEALANETLERFGAVHVLCNNAGIGTISISTWETTLDDWKWILGVNLMGVIYGIRTFMPIMLGQDSESHIVNTASMAGLVAGADGAPYAVTKFGVIALSEHIYLELQRAGARTGISLLCPGFVNTNIMDSARNRPPELPDASPEPTGPLVDVMREWFEEEIRKGLSPRTVGDQVLSAIREERFYILTDSEWNDMIETRVTRILNGENPITVPPPGTEALLEKVSRLTE
jgi:NAD(P)-dependent dehydrogenase (short-subunit alcohol dehydrogenase family)